MVIVEVARRFGVSRSPVKHALGRLCGEGLVEQVLGRGYCVSRIDEDARSHLLKARLLVETAAASIGAPIATDSQLANMQAVLREMSQLIDQEGRHLEYGRFMEADRQFHNLLVETSANPYLIQFHQLLNFHVFQVRMHFAAQLGDRRALPGLQEHHAILSAFESRNATEAVVAVASHIRNSMSAYVDHSKKNRRECDVEEIESLHFPISP